MNIQDAFTTLAQFYGSHSMAASELGFSRDHYRAMRNGRANVPARTANLILLKAQELQAPPATSPAPAAQEVAQ